MKKEYILFIDSGIGGLSTLAETIKILPANYIYFADIKHCPYGSLSHAKITKILKETISSLMLKFNISVVVLACNTATTSAIENLRKTFPKTEFVGTEPAINLAQKKGFKNILCLATPTTTKQKKYVDLTQKMYSKLHTQSMPTLASNIEYFFTNPTVYNLFSLAKDLYEIKNLSQKYDSIVLGCTHYVLVEDIISQISQKTVIHGNIGISRQILKIFKHKNFNFYSQPYVRFLSSDSTNFAKENYKKILGQILAKR